ncbi:hypothetical protein EHRUM1_03980 [Ehrlichia ruminantium]|uniref:Uncharacterized protein n=1 Tax=Ehrlichia ruminantium (strain Welgevonden) TaxID=254945 RepID=A0A0H3LZ87_EHRRW|nr:hypothetical protein [Ehrlichia ruminantium]KYW92700.1 hypothetical protein AUR40_02695 [Ehrlichia ruminantium]QLK50472.1 hypothetical protein FDZ68_02200 [Ehrlichia ruminantium]QLK51397.1 hypothetical protein FDZ66_02205 [Ehrlichia ruminantium]QLK52320.1 hypothetical protein FDZ65_02210 [Ehrlichia ruminantium]QLK53231.1 hypothetical protein FDZ64_02200 [Ehrlichia ruminantium]
MTNTFNNKPDFIEQQNLDEFSRALDDIITKYQTKFENKMEDITSSFLTNFQHTLEKELVSLIKKIYSHNFQELNKYLINQLLSSNNLQTLNNNDKDIIIKIFNKISSSIIESIIF